ncbi:MAG TPA: hypothetical protein VM146_16750 [Steroidobacteraceae bacterium]|nr:hypothetical protein [Steroidobacteraceae bacterium]
MNTSIWKRTLALSVASIFLVTGCAQLQNVPLNHTAQGVARPAVSPGDNVVVTTRDGAKHKFQVTSADAEALQGDHDRINYTDMTHLDVQKKGEMHLSKTALIVGAVVLGAVAIGAASGGSGGGGGY